MYEHDSPRQYVQRKINITYIQMVSLPMLLGVNTSWGLMGGVSPLGEGKGILPYDDMELGEVNGLEEDDDAAASIEGRFVASNDDFLVSSGIAWIDVELLLRSAASRRTCIISGLAGVADAVEGEDEGFSLVVLAG